MLNLFLPMNHTKVIMAKNHDTKYESRHERKYSNAIVQSKQKDTEKLIEETIKSLKDSDVEFIMREVYSFFIVHPECEEVLGSVSNETLYRIKHEIAIHKLKYHILDGCLSWSTGGWDIVEKEIEEYYRKRGISFSHQDRILQSADYDIITMIREGYLG